MDYLYYSYILFPWECKVNCNKKNSCAFPVSFPPQHQNEQSGLEYIMEPQPMAERIKCLGGECLLLQGDLKEPKFAKWCMEKTLCHFRAIDILVNNHAFQFIRRSILEISHEQLEFIFRNREDKLAKFDKESAKIVWISVENTNIIFL